MTIKNYKWTWASNMNNKSNTGNIKIVKVLGSQRTRWRGEISVAGAGWYALDIRQRWRTLVKAFVLQWTNNGQ